MSVPPPPPRNANDVLAKQLIDCAVLVKKGEHGPLLHKTLRDLSKYIGGAPSSVDQNGSSGSHSVTSTEGTTTTTSTNKGTRSKLSQFGKKIVGTLKHSSGADEEPAKPPPVVGRVVHGSADKATWLAGHEHEGDWCEEHFCQGCACKQRQTVLKAPMPATNVTRIRTKPAFHRPANPQSAMVANGWIEQVRRSKMRTVWKEVLASVVEGRKPGEETTLWIQREVIIDGKTTLEALHQLPIRWMQEVFFLGDIENRFSIKIYHLPDEFMFRCPDADAAQNWVLTLRSMKEIVQRQGSAPPPPPKVTQEQRMYDQEKKVVDPRSRPTAPHSQQAPPSPSSSAPSQQRPTSPPQEGSPRMTVKELRAIAHGAGISTIGMERSELEAIVLKISKGQLVADEKAASDAPVNKQKVTELSPDHDVSDRGRFPVPIEHSPSDEDEMAEKQREEDEIEKERARQRQFEKEEAAKRKALREEAERRKAREEEARIQAEKDEEARQREQQEILQRSLAEKVKRQQEQERKRKEEEERKVMEAERLKREDEEYKRRVAELHAADMRKKQEETARLQQEQYKQQQEAWKKQQQAEAERLRFVQQQQAEEARRQHEAFLRQQQTQQQQQHHQQQQYQQWQQAQPGQRPQAGHPQWQHPPQGQHPQWQQQNGYPPNHQYPHGAQVPQQGPGHPGQAPPPQTTSPFSSKYANMAKQNETGSIEKLKHGILVEWALQPPHFQILRPIEDLLMSIHGVFPPRFGVPAHDYFSKWSPIKRDDLSLGPSMGNRTDSEKLNKIVRKQLRFFLHPDKLPKDLSEGQVYVCKLLWDICNDAWEEHKKREEELGWMRS
ncbi:hypothetical protein FisN_4Lh121 [Fistulifera solaris]|uniref:PH domain-containing protein n=1 Tax=Fistulifera solaris TaxID=1519565 RepID=A0A1Z5JZJ2_FISSO|nr:hypothetical protein FisN_4Lh121 [Fistulifera solaris]|eukprot:GAX19302.1 hypothetical protein FisN_4Lh121 [Fistulifera solaris]